jgi:hypothetical protein
MQAAKLAIKEPIGNRATHTIWTFGPVVYVRGVDEPAPDKNAKVYAYAQRWDEHTVQIRSNGANSDFIRL